MTGELSGRVALVTGAAGGIGGAVTALLLAAGAAVVGEDLRPVTPPEGSGDRFAASPGRRGGQRGSPAERRDRG